MWERLELETDFRLMSFGFVFVKVHVLETQSPCKVLRSGAFSR